MPLCLASMTVSEYETGMAAAIQRYAAEKVASGSWPESDALRLAHEVTAKLLPQGLATPDHYFHNLQLQPGGPNVGYFWFAREGAHAYLYDLFLHPDYRGQGLGRQAMRLLEDAVATLGLQTIKLHVFGHNLGARALYTSLGYETTDLTMRKQLPGKG